MFKLQYWPYNSNAILIIWPKLISKTILTDILQFKDLIQAEEVVSECVSAYHTLLVIYKERGLDFEKQKTQLAHLYKQLEKAEELPSVCYTIPVCYASEFGKDLEDFLKAKKITLNKLIALHTKPVYTVFFIGFLPGFLYLGGLDSKLFAERKSTPRFHIKKGDIGIGGQQTGIYPANSPGGWHIIGNTPVTLFNAGKIPPTQINPGDRIKFVSVEYKEHQQILDAVKNGSYQLQLHRHD